MGQATTVEALEKARNDVQRIENKVTAAEQLKGAGLRLVDVGVALMAVSNGENRNRLEAMFSERAQALAQAMQVMQAQLVTEEDRKAFAAIAQISNNVCIQREQAERTLASDDFAGRRVTDLIGEISAATHEQREGFGQVNQAVAAFDLGGGMQPTKPAVHTASRTEPVLRQPVAPSTPAKPAVVLSPAKVAASPARSVVKAPAASPQRPAGDDEWETF